MVVKHPVTIQLENVYDISGIDSDVSAAFYCEVYGIPFPDIYWKKVHVSACLPACAVGMVK